jgi:YVTN family beta-propeller protein
MPVQREPIRRPPAPKSLRGHLRQMSRASARFTTCTAWLLCSLGAALPAAAQPYAYVVVTEARTDNGPARNRLVVIDTVTRTRQASIVLESGCLGCSQPRGLAATPDGARLFVLNHASNTISVVDARARIVVRSVPLGTPVGFLPASLVVSTDGARLYVLKGSTILVLDTRTLGLLASFQTTLSTNSRDILISPDDRQLYVTEALGRLVRLDAASGNVLGAVPVPAGSFNSMELTRDGSTLYVTGFLQIGASNVAVHNAATLQPIATFTAPSFRPRVTPDDAKVWIGGDSAFAIVDRATNTIDRTFPWATGAMGMDFTPEGSQVFVSVFGGVRVVDTVSRAEVGTILIDAASEGHPGPLLILPPPPEPPEPPTGLTVRSIDGLTVTLQWQPPSSGTAPTSYQLEGGIDPGQTLAVMPTGGAAPVFTFTAPPGSFHVRLRSVSGSMQSGPSEEVRLVTVPAGAPSPPERLRAIVHGSSVWLTWRNTFAGGRPEAVVLDVAGDLPTSIPVGLAEGFAYQTVPAGTYTLSLRATNGSGTSAASDPVTVTFPGTCAGAPAAPVGFMAYRLGSTINVLWDPAPSGPATTGYVVTVSGSLNGSVAVTSPAISGTVGPGRYDLTIVATNACGQSAATLAGTVIMP